MYTVPTQKGVCMYPTVTRGDRVVGRVKLFIELMKLNSYMKRHGVNRVLITAPQMREMKDYFTLVTANNRLKSRQFRLEMLMGHGTDDGVIDMMHRHMEVLCARRCVLNELIVVILKSSLTGPSYELLMAEYQAENDEVADLILRKG